MGVLTRFVSSDSQHSVTVERERRPSIDAVGLSRVWIRPERGMLEGRDGFA